MAKATYSNGKVILEANGYRYVITRRGEKKLEVSEKKLKRVETDDEEEVDLFDEDDERDDEDDD